MANGLTIEVISHLLFARELDLINDEELNTLRIQINELTNKLNAFYKTLKKTKLSDQVNNE